MLPARLSAISLCFGVAWSAIPAAEKLYVFYPAAVRPYVLQKGISGLAPGLGVTAFGRYADFEDEVNARPPDAILSLPEVIGALEGYSVAVASRRNGDSVEPYLLLSLEKAVDLSGIAGSTIGIVDFLGRNGMRKYLAGIFQPPPASKTVAKVEDLLPLLTFRMVESILVTASQAAHIQEASRLPFVRTEVPGGKAGTVCLAIRKGASAPKAIAALNAMDAELRNHLGGVQWN